VLGFTPTLGQVRVATVKPQRYSQNEGPDLKIAIGANIKKGLHSDGSQKG
jgi:hypothetical protein